MQDQMERAAGDREASQQPSTVYDGRYRTPMIAMFVLSLLALFLLLCTHGHTSKSLVGCHREGVLSCIDWLCHHCMCCPARTPPPPLGGCVAPSDYAGVCRVPRPTWVCSAILLLWDAATYNRCVSVRAARCSSVGATARKTRFDVAFAVLSPGCRDAAYPLYVPVPAPSRTAGIPRRPLRRTRTQPAQCAALRSSTTLLLVAPDSSSRRHTRLR